MKLLKTTFFMFALAVSGSLLADDAQVAFEDGMAHLNANELEAAVDDLKTAVDLDSDNSEYHMRLGEAYSRQMDDVSMFKAMRLAKKMRVSFQRAVELDPDNLDARAALLGYYAAAPGIAGGSKDKALVQAQEIAKRDEQRGRLAFAQVYIAQDDIEKAEGELRVAMAAAPDDHDPTLILGIHYTNTGEYAKAFDLYQGFLVDHPDNMSVNYQLGRTASISGEYLDEGEAAFQKYLQHEPNPGEPGLDWANYRLGMIYEFKNAPEQARTSYEASLALNSDHKEAKKALKKLN